MEKEEEMSVSSGSEGSTKAANQPIKFCSILKECRVCGGKAYGFNFGVITCESCKAFFRRNALKDHSKFVCRMTNGCQITVAKRRFCSKCRLDKCFETGMDKRLIRPPRKPREHLATTATIETMKTESLLEIEQQATTAENPLLVELLNEEDVDEEDPANSLYRAPMLSQSSAGVPLTPIIDQLDETPDFDHYATAALLMVLPEGQDQTETNSNTVPPLLCRHSPKLDMDQVQVVVDLVVNTGPIRNLAGKI